VQIGRRAVFPPGAAREDWAVLRALSDRLGAPLPWNSLQELRRALWRDYPHLAQDGEITSVPDTAQAAAANASGDMDSAPFRNPVSNFYMTCPVSRASETMAACMREIAARPEAEKAVAHV